MYHFSTFSLILYTEQCAPAESSSACSVLFLTVKTVTLRFRQLDWALYIIFSETIRILSDCSHHHATVSVHFLRVYSFLNISYHRNEQLMAFRGSQITFSYPLKMQSHLMTKSRFINDLSFLPSQLLFHPCMWKGWSCLSFSVPAAFWRFPVIAGRPLCGGKRYSITSPCCSVAV